MYQFLKDLQEKFKYISFYEEGHKYYHSLADRFLISTTTLIGKYKHESDYNIDGIAQRYEIPVSYVKHIWEAEKNRGTGSGSETHNYVEQLGNRNIVNYDVPLACVYQAHQFIKDYYMGNKGYVLFKQEFVLGNEFVGGKPDNISLKENGMFSIIDYKTDKEINLRSEYGNKMKEFLNHLDDCEFIKYSLQTSIYRILFGSELIDESFVIWFNRHSDKYQRIECVFLEDEANALLQEAAKRMR